jgi:hypothetical protein
VAQSPEISAFPTFADAPAQDQAVHSRAPSASKTTSPLVSRRGSCRALLPPTSDTERGPVQRYPPPPSLTSSLLLPKSPQYLQAITNQWNARFQVNVPIPHAGFRMGVANVGARAELVGDVSRMVISTHIAIGACASVRVGWFEREWCNPSALTWLPVRVLQGPTFDFSRFCA